MSRGSSLWQFSIDVGGTFTDCIARDPGGRMHCRKVLSSGQTVGSIDAVLDTRSFQDLSRRGDPPGFWTGYAIELPEGQQSVVESFDAHRGEFRLTDPLLVSRWQGLAYRLLSDEEAPILAIRLTLGLPRDQPLPPISVRLGTTRGTNSLLTRRGAACALVTTSGFADILRIGYQNRPRLFDLDIRKPDPLHTEVAEIMERLAPDGRVLRSADEQQIRRELARLKDAGIESLAICLLHAFRNPRHEQLVEQIARELGFDEISTSHRVAPLLGVVSRGSTTVVDAYLNPVLRSYIESLRRSLGTSDLKIMTSAGGLVDSRHFVGKDSILSGPAGGVVGFSQAAQRLGYDRAIGFDMGGTSTDVARFDGRFEYEFETEKAGVRIAVPMLAIETVAAGGGSICAFDGVKLTVGPDSAGADPGPACYGGGGPLTVTDMNVFLGRIPPWLFPFPLDLAAVERSLDRLADRIADETGKSRLPLCELANGFLRIANANMVRAIRRISVAKGYDPRDYVLVTFGGAGGQHACSVARALGITEIVIHPLAGLLSAHGISRADVRRFAERAVLATGSELPRGRLDSLFAALEAQATRDVLAQGIDASHLLPPIRSLEMRYQGTDAAIHVVQPDDGDWEREFTRRHRQWYGFERPGRPIEIAVARVEVVGQARSDEGPPPKVPKRRAVARQTTRAFFERQWLEVPLYFQRELRPGDEFSGPAIVGCETSTTVVGPGFDAEVLPRGELLIRDRRQPDRESVSDDVDPVSLEIFHNLFASIAEQMGAALERTAVSVNVKERRDFSCAVFTAEGDLVANAPHIPVHLGAMSDTVKAILDAFPDMRPGDVFVTNDPFQGGSHLPDVTVVTPVFEAGSGEHLFFTASRAHHAEIGGIAPGSMPPFSTNLSEEGVLIRPFRLIDGRVSREDELRQLLANAPHASRAIDDNLADITAQIAANRQGAGLLQELCDRYTAVTTAAYMQHIRAAAAKKMRLALSRLPDGEYRFEDHLDCGAPIRCAVAVHGDQAIIDFTGTGEVLSSNLNANRSIVTAALLYVLRCMIREDIPLNSGVLEPVRLILPTCLLNPPPHDDPRKCAAVVGGNVETSSRVVDVLLGALDLAAASQGTMNNLTFGDDSFGYYETIGGGAGATGEADGADAVHSHMTNTRLTDPEVIELRYPVRLERFAIRRGSGGLGRRRGGDGMVRSFEFLRPLVVSLLTERRGPYPPYGLHGGQAGALGKNVLRRAGGRSDEELPAKTVIQVQAGDRLTIYTPGGGGWGSCSG